MENLNSIKKEILQKIKSAESDGNVEEIRLSLIHIWAADE